MISTNFEIETITSNYFGKDEVIDINGRCVDCNFLPLTVTKCARRINAARLRDGEREIFL